MSSFSGYVDDYGGRHVMFRLRNDNTFMSCGHSYHLIIVTSQTQTRCIEEVWCVAPCLFSPFPLEYYSPQRWVTHFLPSLVVISVRFTFHLLTVVLFAFAHTILMMFLHEEEW